VTVQSFSSTQPTEQLFICAFASVEPIADACHQQLNESRYHLILSRQQADFWAQVSRDRQKIDCLILHDDESLPETVDWLNQHATLLPTVILQSQPSLIADPQLTPPELALTFLYHTAEVRLLLTDIAKLGSAIDRAIAEFLNLSPSCGMQTQADLANDLTAQNFILLQQRRLTEKLKERLGYLGVYYKRNPSNFLRAMSPDEAQTFLNKLKESYQNIILGYFNGDNQINQKIDAFVDTAFFADLSVAQVVEIHMDLIGEFSKQLKLEGRSEEILTDYRLTLIDTLAHLCEMYRRSIPQELPDS
jgi:circadian clock protein KaiA